MMMWHSATAVIALWRLVASLKVYNAAVVKLWYCIENFSKKRICLRKMADKKKMQKKNLCT